MSLAQRLLFIGLSGVGVALSIGACTNARQEEPVDALDEALTAEDFDKTVQHLTQLPYLPWAYTTDGCYARATYYSMLLATKGVPSNHIYVVARPGTALGGIWGWHVAPLVTKDSDPNHLYVLDPVYDQTKALTNVEWVAHQDFPKPAATNYPSLHVHPGNSYLQQYNAVKPLVSPGNPTAANYKEPAFAAMPSFRMTDVAQACATMHRYIDIEPGTSTTQKADKHRALGRETQRLVQNLATKNKLTGSPSSLSVSCTRGQDAGDPPVSDDGGTTSGGSDGGGSGSAGDGGSNDPTDPSFIDPTRQHQN